MSVRHLAGFCRTLLRRLTLAAGVAAAGAPACAQDYPRQPVRLVVPFAAGGGVDVVARIISPRLGEELGQPIVIENRGGAGGMLGAQTVVQSPPDGYTLLFGTGSTHGTNSSVYSKLSYDPVRDFVPVVLVIQSPLLLVVPPSLPAATVKDFIALARARKGELNFGTYGPGSINHLGIELFNAMAGIDAKHVPYRGAAPMLVDLIGSRIEYALDGVSTSIGYVQGGTLRLLGVAGTKRSPVLPEAPTIAEAGLPGYDTSVWFGLFAPAGTPKQVVDLVNARVNTTLASQQVKDGLVRLGFEPMGGGPDALARNVEAELKKWTALVRDRNIKVTP